MILDIFSQCVVGWLIADREDSQLARDLILSSSLVKQEIEPGRLTLHADRGPSMISAPVAALLVERGVDRSHNRPYTSSDNPFSEAQFKTLKYHCSYPDRFGSLEHARSYFSAFFPWYNTEHRHSSLALLTPADVHYGRASKILERRQQVLEGAFAGKSRRFKGQRPEAGAVPEGAWINPPKIGTAEADGDA